MTAKKLLATIRSRYTRFKKRHPRRFHWLRLGIIVVLGILILNIGIGIWYSYLSRGTKTSYGVSFSVKQARALGIDPKETFDALLQDMQVRRFRLMSYWDEGEPVKGTYDFTDLDWQFAKAEAAGASITLALGVRQPRWPECHIPAWASSLSGEDLTTAVNTYLKAVIDRYKNSPSLISYQLENEFFIAAFGKCTDFSRNRFVSEYEQLKKLDSSHPVIVSLSHNFLGLPTGKPHADIYGTSIYRRLYSTNYYHGYVTYPVPAWYYTVRAGWIKLWTGRDSIVHEFQMEPWGTKPIEQMNIAEQNESITAQDISGRFGFARATHIKYVDLWGAEWWYWRKTTLNDPSIWDSVKSNLTN